MKQYGTQPVRFRGGELLPPLRERTRDESSFGLGLVAKRDLDRYYAALAAELATLDLSQAEASLIVDATNGTLFEPHTVRLLWASVADAIRLDGLDRKWAVDGDALVARLRGLGYAQALAVVDACERFALAPDDAPNGLAAWLRTSGLSQCLKPD